MKKSPRQNRIPRSAVEGYRQSLRQWKSGRTAEVTDDGEGVIGFATYSNPPCGCRVTGCGTLQLPITIEFCPLHSQAEPLLEFVENARSLVLLESGNDKEAIAELIGSYCKRLIHRTKKGIKKANADQV